MLVNLREYHRPATLDAALALLDRGEIKTVALAGGSRLTSRVDTETEAVVDLQDLSLDIISFSGGEMSLGAMVRVQTLVEELSDEVDGIIAQAAKLMGGTNQRNHITVGGVIAAHYIHSPISIILGALDAEVLVVGDTKELLTWPIMASKTSKAITSRQLVLGVSFAYLDKHGSYQQVSRTAADLPIVGASCVISPDGTGKRATLAIGGFTPGLFHATAPIGADTERALIDQVMTAGKDEMGLVSDYLGDGRYRKQMASVLTRRVLADAIAKAQ